jgi:enamine deaminase RidA (YjgF/YER057c/UK114 family)
MADYADYGYADARRSGKLLFISGQIGMGADGTVPKTPAEQFRLAFAALGEVLKSNGLAPKDIVDLCTYHTGLSDDMETFVVAKKEFLGEALTAWTAIGVQALAVPGALVEIRAIAELA